MKTEFQPTGAMSDDLLRLLKFRGDGLSFAEILRFIPRAAGDRSIELGKKNLLIWTGVSQELIDTINELEKLGLAELKGCSQLTYLADGSVLNLPLARNFRDYKSPHWVPSMLGLKKKLAA